MATKKPKEIVPLDEKMTGTEVDLFEVLAAIDKKDYGYYDRLSDVQQKKLAMKILVDWTSAIKGSKDLQSYYLMSVNFHANKYLFNENVLKNPKLVWLMLCAASPGLGKQFHQWIPNIKGRVSLLLESADLADTKKYYAKIYPRAGADMVAELSVEFVKDQRRKLHLASIYPTMKLEDIETLNQVITDQEIAQYEKDRGN